MTLTYEQIAQNALREVEVSTTGTLPLFMRYDIWQWMNSIFCEAAHRRRILLNSLVIEQSALPVWDRWYPADEFGPRRYLKKIQDVLNGSQSPESLRDELYRENAALIDDYCSREDDASAEEIERANAGYAIIATRAAAWTAARDEPCLKQDLRPDKIVEDDPDEWDAHYFCSVVAANGAEWEEESSVLKRRDYWNRWVTDWLQKACR